MTKKRKARRVRKPNEIFSFGPLTIERYGANLFWSSNWSKAGFEEAKKHQADLLPKVISDIDTLVAEISTLVGQLGPQELLHRAWWEMASKHVRIESEVDIGTDDAIALRMIDYVQSVIAATAPAATQRKISEEDWTSLRSKVEKLFLTLNSSYQICRTAKAQLEDKNFDVNFEEFQFKAQLYWCNVRGHRYQIHEPAALEEMFSPHSAALNELFGISSADFVEQMTKIWHAGLRPVPKTPS